jgi:ribosome-associated translation inhibitor RaiA
MPARHTGAFRRTPLAAATSVSRAAKPTLAPTDADQTPVTIRAFDVAVTPEQRDEMRRKLGAKLGKYARRITRVCVRFDDVNGPRNAPGETCRITVGLTNLPDEVVESRGGDVMAVFLDAATRIERSVRRTLDRTRVTARHGAPKRARAKQA